MKNSRSGRTFSNRRFPTMGVALAVVVAGFISAAPMAGAQTADGSVTNATPVVSSVTLYSAAPTPGSSCAGGTSATGFSPSSGTTRTIHICAVITDDNGWSDVCQTGSSRTYTVKATDGTTTLGSKTGSMTCAAGSGTSVAVTAEFTMEYWRLPATGATYYYVRVDVTDVASASAGQGSASFNYAALTSLHVTDASFSFGSIAPAGNGTDSATIYNYGNQAFTIQLGGPSGGFTGASKSQTIAVGSMTHGNASGSETTALTGSAATTGVTAAVETSDTPTNRVVYLKLTVPAGTSQWVPADTYSGTLTFTAG